MTSTMTSYDNRLVTSLDMAVFKRVGQHFHCETPDTAWLRQMLPLIDLDNARLDLGEFSPYLQSFIDDAETHWKLENTPPIQSVQWIEIMPNGQKLALSARAVNLDDQPLLIINTHGMSSLREAKPAEVSCELTPIRDRLELEVGKRTLAIRKREEELSIRLLSATNMRDQETGAHVRRIGHFASAIAETIGWDHAQIVDIRIAAAMHDLGKIGIPDSILLKPGKLNEREFSIMKTHTTIGASMLTGSTIPLICMAEEIALSHHERWDGNGYPHQLRGEQIPQSARIVSVCDVYDALTNKRVYKPAYSESEARKIMWAEAGSQFDHELLSCFYDIMPTILDIRERVKDIPNEDDDFNELTGTLC